METHEPTSDRKIGAMDTIIKTGLRNAETEDLIKELGKRELTLEVVHLLSDHLDLSGYEFF